MNFFVLKCYIHSKWWIKDGHQESNSAKSEVTVILHVELSKTNCLYSAAQTWFVYSILLRVFIVCSKKEIKCLVCVLVCAVVFKINNEIYSKCSINIIFLINVKHSNQEPKPKTFYVDFKMQK